MVKKPAEAEPKKKTYPAVEALEVVAVGQMLVISEDRKKKPKSYEETFLIPVQYNTVDKARQVVRRCLVAARLQSIYKDDFADIRKCDIKAPPKRAQFEGLGELLEKDIYDLSPEELRMVILFKNIRVPVFRYNQEKKKQEVSHYLDSIELIKRTGLDIDLAEKAKKYMGAKQVPVQTETEPEDAEAGEVEGAAEAKPANWEALDE